MLRRNLPPWTAAEGRPRCIALPYLRRIAVENEIHFFLAKRNPKGSIYAGGSKISRDQFEQPRRFVCCKSFTNKSIRRNNITREIIVKHQEQSKQHQGPLNFLCLRTGSRRPRLAFFFSLQTSINKLLSRITTWKIIGMQQERNNKPAMARTLRA